MTDFLCDPKHFRPISSAGMRKLDRLAAENFAMPALLLMENAGRAVALAARRMARGSKKPIVIFCGGGNNGGDGLAAARYLSNWGYAVKLVLDRSPKRYEGDALVQWNAAKCLKIPFQIFHSRQKLLQFITQRPVAAVDALLGTGFHGPLKDAMLPLIDAVNGLACPVIAVDVPSGLDADSGSVRSAAVKARLTVTLGLPKTGLLRSKANFFVGKLLVADIGFPRPLVRRFLK